MNLALLLEMLRRKPLRDEAADNQGRFAYGADYPLINHIDMAAYKHVPMYRQRTQPIIEQYNGTLDRTGLHRVKALYDTMDELQSPWMFDFRKF